MTLTVERRSVGEMRRTWGYGGETWHTWGVTCHPTGEGLDGHSWTWEVAQDRRYDPPQWHAYPPVGVRLTAPARDRWQRAVVDAVVEWERAQETTGGDR